MFRTLLERLSERYPPRTGFKVTESLISDIKADVPNASPIKVAHKFGVPVGLVRFIINETPNPNTEFTKLSEDGWGRPALRRFILTRKPVGESWPKADEENLQKHRELYDAGLVEMCQGRDGDFIIQYSMPRRKPASRRHPWFKRESEYE